MVDGFDARFGNTRRAHLEQNRRCRFCVRLIKRHGWGSAPPSPPRAVGGNGGCSAVAEHPPPLERAAPHEPSRVPLRARMRSPLTARGWAQRGTVVARALAPGDHCLGDGRMCGTECISERCFCPVGEKRLSAPSLVMDAVTLHRRLQVRASAHGPSLERDGRLWVADRTRTPTWSHRLVAGRPGRCHPR